MLAAPVTFCAWRGASRAEVESPVLVWHWLHSAGHTVTIPIRSSTAHRSLTARSTSTSNSDVKHCGARVCQSKTLWQPHSCGSAARVHALREAQRPQRTKRRAHIMLQRKGCADRRSARYGGGTTPHEKGGTKSTPRRPELRKFAVQAVKHKATVDDANFAGASCARRWCACARRWRSAAPRIARRIAERRGAARRRGAHSC